MPKRTPARYRDARGRTHTLQVRAVGGGWQITDVSAGVARVVETLSGDGEGPHTAAALARDYAACRHHPGDGAPHRHGRAA